MSDDVRADARRLLHGITPGKWRHGRDNFGFHTISAVRTGVVYATGQPGEGVRIDNPADAEFIAAAPTLVDRLLTELDRVTGHLNAELVMRDEAEDATRHYEIQRDAALATLQQVREWAEQRRYDGPSTDDLATVLLDGAAHQLFRILDGGVSNV